jgi:anaerobic dimethyl sulfoxide reductase subunit C (anchor subunit)
MVFIQSIHGNEWSLIAFTVLAQMAVGTFIIREVVRFLAVKKYGTETVHQTADISLLAIGAAMILAVVVSFFHLGSPLKAYHALNNLSTSWLSREILFVILFTAAVVILLFLKWRGIAGVKVRNWLVSLTGLLGLTLIFCMTRVYMLPTVPVWNNPFTPLSFWITAFLLGSLAVSCGMAVQLVASKRNLTAPRQERQARIDFAYSALRLTLFTALLLIGLELISVPLFMLYMGKYGVMATGSLSIPGTYITIVWLRLVLLISGALLIFFTLYQSRREEQEISVKRRLVLLSFLVVLAAEVVGRYLFYALYTRVGI